MGAQRNYARDRRERLQSFAVHMRRHPTYAEAALWAELRKRPNGLTFWNQHVIGNRYIADFYCPAAKLVIEVDGSSHLGREVRDRQRDENMKEFGYRIVRLTNEAVLNDLTIALTELLAEIDGRAARAAQRRHAEEVAAASTETPAKPATPAPTVSE